MCRKEFIELVARCAVIKHEDLPVLEAAEEFLQKNLLIWLPSMSFIRDFRVNELWTKSVHEVFMLNRTEILRSLDCYSSPLKYSSLVQIFMEDSEPPIVDNEADLIQAAVLSKMAVVNDAGHEAVKMSQYSEVEFYEILARVVQAKCQNSMMEDMFLHLKIESILDQIIQISAKSDGEEADAVDTDKDALPRVMRLDSNITKISKERWMTLTSAVQANIDRVKADELADIEEQE